MPETTPRAHIIGVSRDAPLQHHHYVQGYLYACEAEGKSPATVASYAENLGRFQSLARELGLPSNPHDITRQHVRMFLAHLHRLGNSPATVNDRLAVLRLWFKWLKAEGIVGHDPTEGVGKVRQEKKVLNVLTPAQVKDLLAVCQRQGRKHKKAAALAARNRAIVLVLYNCGLRATELVALDLADVDFQRVTAHVRHGKGAKERLVWLGRLPRQALWRYVTLYRGQEPGPLFPSERGGRMLRTSLTQLLTKLARKTNWPDKACHPHMFRRTFAVQFIRNGGDPFRLQMLLGHEKLDMTRHYSQALSQEDALRAHEAASPGDRL